ncbi:MAG: MarR family winged helix-turn-helix transcriptional regulator [Ignavibacteriales bacterium]
MAERLEVLRRLLKVVNRDVFDLTRDVFHRFGLPAPGMVVLAQAVESPGATISEIARRTGIAKSHISKTVEHLAEQGFLEKRPDPSDQRLVRIYATEKAERRSRQVEAAIREGLLTALSGLPSDRVEGVIDGLRVLHEALARGKREDDSR